MTPEELNERMALIARIQAKWKAEDQMRFEERPEVVESRKVMRDVQDRLEKLLEHERRKLKEWEDRRRPPEEA